MDLISLVFTLAIVGLVVYLILQLPMPEIFKQGIQIVAVIFVIFWLIRVLSGGVIPNVLP